MVAHRTALRVRPRARSLAPPKLQTGELVRQAEIRCVSFTIAPEAEAAETSAVASAVMEQAAEPAVALSVPLVVDARAATNWDEAH